MPFYQFSGRQVDNQLTTSAVLHNLHVISVAGIGETHNRVIRIASGLCGDPVWQHTSDLLVTYVRHPVQTPGNPILSLT